MLSAFKDEVKEFPYSLDEPVPKYLEKICDSFKNIKLICYRALI